MNKLIIFSILAISASFALDIPTGTCEVLELWNATANETFNETVCSPQLNISLNLTAGSIYEDTQAGIYIVALHDNFNLFLNLSCGSNYTNPNLNISIIVPECPPIQNITNNITINVPNQIVNLNHGQNYTFGNLSVFAPLRQNVNRTLTFSDWEYRYEDANITVRVLQEICNQAVNVGLDYSQNYTNSLCGINVSAPQYPSFETVQHELRAGEVYDYLNGTFRCAGLPPISKSIILKTMQGQNSYYNETYGLSVNCISTPISSITINESCEGSTMLTTILPNNESVNWCAKNFLGLCSDTEKVNGWDGITGCVERLVSMAASECGTSRDQLNKCFEDKRKAEESISVETRLKEDSAKDREREQLLLLAVFVFITLITLIAVAVMLWRGGVIGGK